ncbi:LOB domain-containing protein 24-like [Zingiber officinale]|uniref:LOB domain-containing protein 24-like n=1 Tax=Zingiber officinale TaxID=94328 RepID=UPI001C4D60AD|nr:LOB domain-containing protein 24-like [Zingiber officinale]
MEQRETISACAACKKMSRECPPDCIFAPYFPATSTSFDCVQRIYGCDNVGRILQSLPVEERRVAAESLVFQAKARIRDPIFGCVGYICFLQHYLAQIDREIQETEAEISAAGYQPPQPPPPEQHWHQIPQMLEMPQIPSTPPPQETTRTEKKNG